MPTALETCSVPCPPDEARDAPCRSRRDRGRRVRTELPRAVGSDSPGPVTPCDLEADAVGALVELGLAAGRRRRVLPSRLTTIVNGRPLVRVDVLRDLVGGDRRAGDRRGSRRPPSGRPRPRAGPSSTRLDGARRPRRGEHEDDREDHDREERRSSAGPAAITDDPLPRGLAPVRVGRERPVELLEDAVLPPSSGSSAASCARAASSSPRFERGVERGERPRAALLLLGLEALAEVAGRRPVHARDLHVAAERERRDAVLDAAADASSRAAARSRGRTSAASSRPRARRRSGPPRG